MIDNLVEEYCDQKMLEEFNKSLGDLDEGSPEPLEFLATFYLLTGREEIIPLFDVVEIQEVVREEPQSLF